MTRDEAMSIENEKLNNPRPPKELNSFLKDIKMSYDDFINSVQELGKAKQFNPKTGTMLRKIYHSKRKKRQQKTIPTIQKPPKTNTADATIQLEATKNKKTVYINILDTKEHVTEIPAGNYIIKAELKKHNEVINTKKVTPVVEKEHTPTNPEHTHPNTPSDNRCRPH